MKGKAETASFGSRKWVMSDSLEIGGYQVITGVTNYIASACVDGEEVRCDPENFYHYWDNQYTTIDTEW